MPKPSTAPISAHKSTSQMAVAACSMSLAAGGNVIQLLPAGAFRARDGRPYTKDGKRGPDWFIDAALAEKIVALVAARGTPLVIDYDHQTLRAQKNGQPAPAAGWFHQVEWREGEGLFAVDVTWTEAASSMIAANEYKFISPVIAYDQGGAITGLLMAAITNDPAIDAMDEVMLAAASCHYATLTTTDSLTTEPQMDDLLEQLRWLLNLPVGATAEDVLAQLTKLADLIKQGQDATAAAATFDLIAMIKEQRAEIASLSSATPDPAQYVPLATMVALQQQIADLSGTVTNVNLDKVIADAKAAGKLLPAQEAWARQLGAKDMAALSSFIQTAPALPAITGMQSDKTPKPGTEVSALSADQLQMCQKMGQDPKAFLATLQAEAAT